jgi:hypothetical protein
MVSLEFFIDIILTAALWPWGQLSLWQKWVPGICPWGGGCSWRQPVCKADNLTTFMCQLSWNVGASVSWNPLGLSRPVVGLLCLLLTQGLQVFHSLFVHGLCDKTLWVFQAVIEWCCNYWIKENLEWSRLGLIKVLAHHFPTGTKGNHKEPQDSPSPNQDANLAHPKWKYSVGKLHWPAQCKSCNLANLNVICCITLNC